MKLELKLKAISATKILNSFYNVSGIEAKLEATNVLLAPRKRFDAIISIPFGRVEQPYVVEIRSKIDNADFLKTFLSQVPPQFQPMVLAEQMTHPIRQKLKERGVAYLVADGDFFLPVSSSLIRHEPHRGPIKRVRSLNGMGEVKLGYVLLGTDGAIARRMRLSALADNLNVSIGHISSTLSNWEKTGLVRREGREKEIIIPNVENFVRRWATAYVDNIKYHPSIFKGAYKLRKENFWMDGQGMKLNNAWWGGEPGAALLTQNLYPEVFTLYSSEPLKHIHNFGLEKDPKGNFLIFEPFWSDIQETIFLPSQFAYAPPLVLYADLLYSPSSRNQKVAESIFREHVHEVG